MKKTILLLIAAGFCFVQTAFPQTRLNIKEKLSELAERVLWIEQEIKIMTQETEVVESAIYEQTSDPIEDGDLKDVANLIVLNNCDSANTWTVQSGNGVTITLVNDDDSVIEGTGAVRVTVPAGANAIVKTSFNASNIAAMRHLSLFVKPSANAGLATVQGWISEDANSYNQTNLGNKIVLENDYRNVKWDLSSVSQNSRDNIVLFSLKLPFDSGNNLTYLLDYLRAEEYHQLKVFMGQEIRNILPKIYSFYYTGSGNNANQTVQIARKGAPTSIEWWSDGRKPYIWISGMGNNTVMAANAANDVRMTLITDVLMIVGDCSFVVTGALNVLNDIYRYRVMWQD